MLQKEIPPLRLATFGSGRDDGVGINAIALDSDGEVSASYDDGGVMGHDIAAAHDPSDRVGRGHLPI